MPQLPSTPGSTCSRSRNFAGLLQLSSAVIASAALLFPNCAFAGNDAFNTNPTASGSVANFTGNFTLGTTTPAAGGTDTPASGDALYFGTSSTTTLNDDLAADTVFAGLFFNPGASAFTIGGNAFTLSAGITNNSTSSQTINNAVTLSANQTWLAGSASGTTLILGGSVTGTGITLTTNGGTGGATVASNTGFQGVVNLGTLVAQGNTLTNGVYAVNNTTTFNGATLNAGNISFGRSNLVFTGATTANITGNIVTNSSWGSLTIQGSANVTAAAVDVKVGDSATGELNLYGGTLTTGGITAVDRQAGNDNGAGVVFNGTQVIARQNNNNFVAITGTAAYISTGGALLNSNTFNIGIASSLKDLTTTQINNGIGKGGAGVTTASAGAGFLTKTGTGTLTLSGTNTYSGGTNINAGTLQLGSSSVGVGNAVTSGAVGTGTVKLSGASLDVNDKTLGNNVTLTANGAILNSNSTSGTVAGNVSGAFTLTTNGNTTGNRRTTFTGTTSIGALQVQGSASNDEDRTGTTNPTTIFNNASLTTTGNVSIGRSNLIFQGTTTANIGGTLGTAGATSSDWAYTTIRDSANVTVTGGVDLTANNSVTGELTLLGGTLTTSGFKLNNRGGQSNVTSFNGTQVVATGSNADFINVVNQTNGGGNFVYAGTGGAKFDTNSYNLTINTSIRDLDPVLVADGVQQMDTTGVGAGTLTKTGLGTLTLTGSNTYTGATTIGTSAGGASQQTSATANGGTLAAAGNGALGSGTTGTASITVNNGGTLLLSGTTTTGTTPGGVSDRVRNTAGISLGTSGAATGSVGGTIAISPTSGNPVLEGTAFSRSNASTTAASPYATNSPTSVVGMGALTLSSSSTLDFGANGYGTLVFSSFTPGSFTLNIINYINGTFNSGNSASGVDGASDRLVFNQDQSGNLSFFNFGSGLTATQIQLDNGFYEIGSAVTPVPEPSTWVGAGLISGLAAWTQRKRLVSLRLQLS